MSVAISFVCKENLKLSNNYTSKCKKNINFWSKKFDVFVLTNNVDEFKDYKCQCFFDDSYYSTFNRFDILNELQKKYEVVIYLDSDEHFFIEDLVLNELPEGIHSYGKWVDNWGNIKSLDYFKVWRQHINVDDDVYFPWESVFVLKSNNLWDSTYNEILKCKLISRETEKQATIDENPHHGVERCEAIGLYVACQTTNFPLHLNSVYAAQFWEKRNNMKDLKVIFVNWTKPFFHKNDAEGYNKIKMSEIDSDEYNIIDYELLIQKVAVLRAKKHIGKTKLYTDTIGYEFYSKMNMLELWDEIDIDTLNQFNLDNSNVVAGKFWTTGKSIVIGKQSEPFVFLDNDFIVRDELPKWIFDYDLVHTHWEIQRGEFFVSNGQIEEIGGIDDFAQNMLMPNTSFLYINNSELCEDYLKKHLDIISREYKTIPEWLWLLADQGIMGYSARKLNLKVESLENTIYVSYPEVDTSKVGCGPFWVKNPHHIEHQSLNYEHVWFTKHRFKTDLEYRILRIKELENEYKLLSSEVNENKFGKLKLI